MNICLGSSLLQLETRSKLVAFSSALDSIVSPIPTPNKVEDSKLTRNADSEEAVSLPPIPNLSNISIKLARSLEAFPVQPSMDSLLRRYLPHNHMDMRSTATSVDGASSLSAVTSALLQHTGLEKTHVSWHSEQKQESNYISRYNLQLNSWGELEKDPKSTNKHYRVDSVGWLKESPFIPKSLIEHIIRNHTRDLNLYKNYVRGESCEENNESVDLRVFGGPGLYQKLLK